MVLNITVGLYVRNFIFFFYKQKTRWNSDLWNIFWRKTQFRPIFYCKSVVWAKSTIMTSLWRHTWVVCTCWGYVWKEETHSYTMVPNKHTSGVHFSSSQGKIAWLDEVYAENELEGYELKHFRCILYSCFFLQSTVIILSYRMKWQLYVLCQRRFFMSSNTHFHSTLSIYGSIWLNFGMVPIHPAWCANSPQLCQFAPACGEFLFSLIKQKLKYLKS